MNKELEALIAQASELQDAILDARNTQTEWLKWMEEEFDGE